MQLAAATGLVVLNDPESHPTYETQYTSSWIDVTLATAATLSGEYTWHVQLLGTIANDPWFDVVTCTRVRSPEALEYILGRFYDIFDRHCKRHLRPIKSRGGGNSWWTPALAAERRRVNALRRRFQRRRDQDVRIIFRVQYSAALAAFRVRISAAKRAYEQECHAACSRGNVFSASFREAFGKVQTSRCLPPLERPDGSMTETHLESAALLLRTQVAIDDPTTDTPHHAAIRRLAADTYDHSVNDIPFSEVEVRDVVVAMPPRSAPGPDGITPLLMKGLFRVSPALVTLCGCLAFRLLDQYGESTAEVMSTPSSTNAVSPAGSVSPDLGDVSGASSAAFSAAGNDFIAELAEQNSREGLNLSTRHDPSTASTSVRLIPATHPDDEDAISSVSQTTAVPHTLRTDVGTRVQTRACEIEELSRYCVETANRIPVNARHFIMARVFELVKLCSDLRADAASERGAVTALQGQLQETRREVADLHRRAVLAETRTDTVALSEAAILPAAAQTSQARPGFPAGPPGALLPSSAPPTAAMTYAAALQAGAASTALPTGPSVTAPARGLTLHEYVAFANIDPAAHDIRDVTLRQTRYGLTVLAHSRHTLTNMRQAIADNAITCAALSMRIPDKRVDPDITSEEFISRVAERNPHLQLDTDKCKVRASFKERSGTSAFVAEVDPDEFARIMRQPRISVGWTSLRVTEDLHVATCTFCATYGHGRSWCPLRSEPARAVCTRCGTEGHLGTACTSADAPASRPRGILPVSPSALCFLTESRDFGQEPIMAARNRGPPAVRGDNRGIVRVNFIQLNLDHAKRAFANLPKERKNHRKGLSEPSLTFKESLSVLGVIFDRRLTFFHHADYLRNKVATLASRVATFLAMQRSCVRPTHKVLLYRQVILPALTYASPVWWGESHVDCRLYARMVTIQRVALLALTRAYRTTSTAAFQVLMQAPPIDLELERINAEFRLFTLRKYVAFGSLRYCPDWVANPHSAVATHPAAPAIVPFTRLTSAQARAASRASAVQVYTDGSFTSTSAGAAYVIFAPPDRVLAVGRYRLLRATSAYSAEVVAFREALRHLIAARYFEPVALYTDCLTLLQALASPRNVEPHVLEIRAVVRKLSRAVHVYLHHAPDHAGVFGNEVADFIAERAAHRGIEVSLPLPFRAVRSQLRRELLVLWTARWRAEHSRTELFRWITDLRTLPSYFPPPPSLVTLLTGHGRFPHYFVSPHAHAPLSLWFLLRRHDAYKKLCYSDVLACPRNRGLLIGAPRNDSSSFYVSGPVRPYRFDLSLTPSRQQLPVLCRPWTPWLSSNTAVFCSLAGGGHSDLLDTTAVTALVHLKTRLLQLKTSKIPAVLMALDFQGAFDSVWHPLVVKFFRDRLVPCNVYHLLLTFLEDRMERVRPTIRGSRDSRSIAYKESLRILGVVFDRRLSFLAHADHLKQKAELLCAKLATLARMQGGQLRPTQKIALYRQVLLPAITYGSPVWWDELRPDSRLKARVLSIQRTILLQLLGAFRTTRTAALQVLMHAPPLTLVIGPWLDHPATRLAFPFARLDRTAAKRMAQQHALHVYTDGSYSPRLAGAAFVAFRPIERIGPIGRFRVDNATSAYCTELIALQEALLHIRNTARPNDTVHVYTHSLALLQALSTPRTSDSRVHSLKRILRDISPCVIVRLYHVPGHTGVLGNELADFLAARAAQRGVPKRALLTSRGVRSILRDSERQRWQTSWQEQNADTALINWVPHVSDIPGWFPPNKHLVQFMTGHGRFHFYFRRFRLFPNETCTCGLPCEGIDHYLYACSLTAPLAGQITPRTAYLDRNYPVLLRHARNRAIFIRMVHAVSAMIPDLPAS
ncbi:hypothetical protein HPB52_023761 [Rhipicephalus sanguineus]|uniref:Uncharacterized protein n=1 Tax=Rhipicephalus sanguineus TaxID=34632 RepID=A0A9D4Q3Q8_RHISA|nr:hypothetical protein HPB52_023761 [Rhipicephalus sanguineus]